MDTRKRDPRIEHLFKAILTLNDLNDCYDLFNDLCTESELSEMSRRFWAAKLLSSGHVYADIAEQTGLSTATISRVNKCLKFGDGGYIRALESVAWMEKAEKNKR